jgi:NAD(P)H-hydrate epimerase
MCHPEVLLCIYKTVEDVLSYIKNKHISSLVIGPGLEVSKSNKEFIKTILFSSQLPVILDASGITCFNNDINILSKNINSKLILTPHLGEFARLLNININEIKHLTQKRDILNSLVKHTNITFVLKGYNTIVANKNNFYVNNTGTPAMATAGSGDVLSGIIATFISIRDIDIFEAIRFAVFVHGLAGEYTEYKHGPVGIMASDIANNVRFIIKQLMYNKKLVYRIHINIKKQYFL